jgi:hypothetical protein
LASGRHTVQAPDSWHPAHPPVRSNRESAIAPKRASPAALSSTRLIYSSRPTLQIETRPCGSAWKNVCPALQPVKTFR